MIASLWTIPIHANVCGRSKRMSGCVRVYGTGEARKKEDQSKHATRTWLRPVFWNSSLGNDVFTLYGTVGFVLVLVYEFYTVKKHRLNVGLDVVFALFVCSLLRNALQRRWVHTIAHQTFSVCWKFDAQITPPTCSQMHTHKQWVLLLKRALKFGEAVLVLNPRSNNANKVSSNVCLLSLITIHPDVFVKLSI